MCVICEQSLSKSAGSLDNPLVSFRPSVGRLGWGVCWGRGVGGGRLVSVVAMVIVKIMLSVSGVAIIPL